MVERVMRRGLHAKPYSEVSISKALSTSSVLSRGSPIPMNTMLVSFSNSGTDTIWLMISVAVRFFLNPCFPVMQNRRSSYSPLGDETHKVALSRSGI